MNGNIFIKLTSPLWIGVFWLSVQFPKQVAVAQPDSQSPKVTQQVDDSQSICPGDLEPALAPIIQRPEFLRSRWGILIQTLNSGQTLYSLNDRAYFIPASNAKLLTTAAVLRQLGSQFRLRTSAYATGNPPHLNTLRILGRGDATITTNNLKYIATQLKSQGVRHISQLIIDSSYFQQSGINGSWEWSDLISNYAVSVNPLILQENAVTLTLSPQKVGQPLQVNWSAPIAGKQWQISNQTVTAPPGTPNSLEIQAKFATSILEIKGKLAIDAQPESWDLAVVDPDQYFLDSFLQVLKEEGIGVDKALITKKKIKIESEKELAFIESDNLAALVKKTNQESNNLFAESLLQILGSESRDRPGLDVLKQTLTELGVNPDSYRLIDGSGLSHQNLVSPEALVTTLRAISQTSWAETYRDSLAVAGVSGTLKKRFQTTTVQGNLQGKTGTISGVSSLSGYLNIINYQPLVFSIILNQSTQSNQVNRDTIDQIILLLSKLHFC